MKKQQPAQLGIHRFDPTKVMYLTGETNYSYVHLSTGEIILFSRTLKWFEEQWPTFLRIHKQTLVNPAYIQEVKLARSTRRTSYLIMRNKTRFAISRRRLAPVIDQLTPQKPGNDPLAAHTAVSQERTRLSPLEVVGAQRGILLG